jgi:hypothetical protein
VWHRSGDLEEHEFVNNMRAFFKDHEALWKLDVAPLVKQLFHQIASADGASNVGRRAKMSVIELEIWLRTKPGETPRDTKPPLRDVSFSELERKKAAALQKTKAVNELAKAAKKAAQPPPVPRCAMTRSPKQADASTDPLEAHPALRSPIFRALLLGVETPTSLRCNIGPYSSVSGRSKAALARAPTPPHSFAIAAAASCLY